MQSSISGTAPNKASERSNLASGEPTLFRSGAEVRAAILIARQAGKSVGFVPTMGALHDGHISLLETARSECDLTVASIFVNPTQFSPQEDFRNYPRDLTKDIELLGRGGCDLVFAPNDIEMYGPGFSTFVDIGPIGQILEGEFRPTHFRGVATIVLKLFQLVPADRAYFGRKDYQQSIVVQQMVADLNLPITLRVCPTVREPDGLAMSSRNVYLSSDERRRAASLSKSLRLAEKLAKDGERDVATIRRLMQHEIDSAGGIKVQYIAFVADSALTPVARVDGPTTVVLAAIVGNTRLLDNMLIGAS
ncbi:MAG TPA: pantoate--beta-alanine ligase [Lacipirellulaceae bacterium]|nr:pantoate--beta-alanine ligase [Lacipirellulaceae bacterium]